MKFKFFVIILLLFFLYAGVFALASTVNGTIDSTYKYAWGENTGWINFGDTDGDIHVTNSALTGYAWSDNYGWINLAPTNGGVLNDGSGNLSGSAWGENIGWIDFSSVIINSSGEFTGTASGDNSGTVNFNCGSECLVKTDWRPQEQQGDPVGGSFTSSGGGLSKKFQLSINSGAVYTNNNKVELVFSGGDQSLFIDISNYSDLRDLLTVPYSNKIPWVLSQGDGIKFVYARVRDSLFNISNKVSASIILNTKAPDFYLEKLKDSYWSDQEVILIGKTDPYSKLIFSFDDKYALLNADGEGNWEVNLGKLSEGRYSIEITISNQFNNKRSVTLEVISQDRPLGIPPEKESQPFSKWSLLNNIKDRVDALLGVKKSKPISPVVTIPKETPKVLRGEWNLLPVKSQQ